jgi:hypothetical protein
MRLRDVLDMPGLRLAMLCGGDDLDRPVQRVYTTDLLDPSRYLSGDELILTGLMWWHDPKDSESFAANLSKVGVAAVCAGEAAHGQVPPDLVDACRRHGLTLFAVPIDVSFLSITEQVSQSIMAQRASALATLLGRQRGLVSAMARGAQLPDLLPSVARELGVSCWVFSATGRIIAGTGPLPAPVTDDLTSAFLVADRLPRVAVVDGRRFLLLPAPGRPAHRLAAWCLACQAAGEGPPAEPLSEPPSEPLAEAAEELLSLVTLERAQIDQGRHAEHRIGTQLMRLMAHPGEPSDLRAALRACRLAPDASYLVATAGIVDATSGSASVRLATYLLDDLVRPLSSRMVVGRIPDGATAVLAVARERAAATTEALRASAQRLAPGLRAQRLAIGVSDIAYGSAALTGAAEQARHTYRAAARMTEPTVVMSSSEVASHVMLLASVGADARQSFRSRVLGPLTAYDRNHNADLVGTLEKFLRSGSWQQCADEMHVHVNTLRYRLQRIEQLTGRDLKRIEDRVDFFLALRLPQT